MSNPRLNNLDTALHELGMLATCTNSRQEYLKEIQPNKKMLNTLTINTRYVSNFSIGFRVRPITPHVRYKPYNIIKRGGEERHRTKSENNDSNESIDNLVKTVVEDPLKKQYQNDTTNTNILKKAKSLESIIAENSKDGMNDPLIISLPEMEVVSHCIEKLKVNE